MSELEAVKKKIRALSAMTEANGASEAEAMLAMKKVGALLLQFNLSMDEVSVREEPCVTRSFSTGSKRRNSLWSAHAGIQSLCAVKAWIQRSDRGMEWYFFGLESDVLMALFLCDTIQRAEKAATAAFKKTTTYLEFGGHKKIATNNFMIGFGRRILERLSEEAQIKRREEQAAHAHHCATMAQHAVTASDDAYKSRGTALVCVAKEQRVNEEFKKHGPKLVYRRSYSKARQSFTAQDAGRNAANSVNLSRPIGGGNDTLRLA